MAGNRIIGIIFCAVGLLSFSGFVSNEQENKLEESIKRGELLYKNHCIACHMSDGKGIPGVFPPLAGSDFLLNKPEESINAVLYGLTGEVTVNGEVYFGEMLPIKISDQEVTDVLNFVRNNWGNNSDEIKIEEVTAQRKE